MSDTADRYATREEIENAFRQCRIAVAALAAIRFNLEHLPLPWALDPLVLSAQDVYEVEPGCTALAVAMRPIVERRQHGDFYPFPEPLGDAERAEYATLLASHRKTIERIRDEAETQLDILGQSLLHAESEMPEFRFMGREFRWGFDAIFDAGALLLVWIHAAQTYLDSLSAALREKLTAYPVPTTSQEWESLGPHLRIEESRLLRDWATLAPLVPSLGVVTRSPGAIEAPSSPPAIAAAADAPSVDPATQREPYYVRAKSYSTAARISECTTLMNYVKRYLPDDGKAFRKQDESKQTSPWLIDFYAIDAAAKEFRFLPRIPSIQDVAKASPKCERTRILKDFETTDPN